MKRGKHLINCLGAILILTGTSLAQDSINVNLIGQLEYWGDVQDMAKVDSYAYVIESALGGNLHIVNVSDPNAPREEGHCALPSYPRKLAVHGNYAYVGISTGLCVVDVSNPREPQLVGQCALASSYTRDIVTAYPYVYTANYYDGIYIIDVSHPTAPVIVGSLDTPGQAQALSLVGPLLYLADGLPGVQIIDVTTPAVPVRIGGYHTPNYAREITVQSSLAYVLDGIDEWTPAAGLMILDLADPIHPTLLSSYGAYVRSGDIYVGGNYAYVAGNLYSGTHLRIIDISNPLAPQEVCLFPRDGSSIALQLDGFHLYLGGDGLTILDVTNPPTPVWVSQYNPDYGARELVVQDSYAYVVNYVHGGLDVLDVSNPSQPQWLSFCGSPDSPRNVALNWPYAFLADQSGGLRIINVADPNHPVEAAYYDPVSPNLTVTDVSLDSPYAYLAGGSGGLVILDVSDPLNPIPAGSVAGVQPYLIKVAGPYAYTAEASASPFDGMRIFSLTDPIHPVQVGSLFFPGSVQDMDVEGGYAYITTSSTLFIIDVSNPAVPTVVYGPTPAPWEGYSLDVEGSLLFVVKSDFFVLNVSNPASPELAGLYNYDGTGRGVTVVDSIAYVGMDSYFNLFDCSDCFGMVSVSLEPVNPPITIPASGGSFQYVATVTNTLPQLQTRDAWITMRMPNQSWYGPVLGPLTLSLPSGVSLIRQRFQNVPASFPAGNYLYEARLGNYPNQITAIDHFTFIKQETGNLGLEVNDWTCSGEPFPGENLTTKDIYPLSFILCPSQPNPFNPTTAIRYKLRVPCHVSLKVYDTAGRLVTILVDGWRAAGTHEVTFEGSKLASGIYLASLQAGKFTSMQKLVLLK